MRTRTRFAAPFVMVIASACGSSKPDPKFRNPPPPKHEDADCKDGRACTEEGKSCYTEGGECSVAHECRGGVWSPVPSTCNPPAPE